MKLITKLWMLASIVFLITGNLYSAGPSATPTPTPSFTPSSEYSLVYTKIRQSNGYEYPTPSHAVVGIYSRLAQYSGSLISTGRENCTPLRSDLWRCEPPPSPEPWASAMFRATAMLNGQLYVAETIGMAVGEYTIYFPNPYPVNLPMPTPQPNSSPTGQ